MGSSAGNLSGSLLVAGTFYDAPGYLLDGCAMFLSVHDQHAAALGGWCGKGGDGDLERMISPVVRSYFDG